MENDRERLFYVRARFGPNSVAVPTCPGETVADFKGHLAAMSLEDLPDVFELRTDHARDVILRDEQRISEVFEYSFLTPLVHVLAIDAHGSVAPLYERRAIAPLALDAQVVGAKNKASVAEYYSI